MKYILSFFLTLSVLCTTLSAVEYGFIINTNASSNPNYLVLDKGDVLEAFAHSNGPQRSVYVFSPQVDINQLTSNSWGDLSQYKLAEWNVSSYEERTFCGPAVVAVANTDLMVSYKLTRASEVEYKNVNIVALPAASVGQGTHQIVVEASDDLQTWTPVHSSSIGGNKAFFRTRVVEAD